MDVLTKELGEVILQLILITGEQQTKMMLSARPCVVEMESIVMTLDNLIGIFHMNFLSRVRALTVCVV